MKNYYQILGIKQTASEDEIKRSYRVLAKRYHPDVNPGDSRAADKFADINEAHSVLSDAKKRAEYDAQLREALSPTRNEDVLARQRAQAQAAARQAAYAQRAQAQAAARAQAQARAQAMARAREAVQSQNILRAQAQARAAQAQAQAQVRAAQAQAAQVQDQTMQAQINALREKAFNEGKKVGAAESKRAADRRISQLEKEVAELKTRNYELEENVRAVEGDRAELEQELFNRDKELTKAKTKIDELNNKIKEQQAAKRQAQQQANAKLTAELNAVKADYANATERIQTLEQELARSELNYNAQIKLQQEKRKQLQNELASLKLKNKGLSSEVDALKAENEQWQQYAKSEDFISDAEARMQEWEKKQKADKKLARNTLYGALGVLIWAESAELDAAYVKLKKRYSAKQDDASVEKLKTIETAYTTLSDPDKRKAYNATIGISDERIAEERQAIVDNDNIMREYRDQLDNRAFWQRFDDLNFNAQAGDADSENKLGEMYYYGDEIEQDLEQAVYWFKEAAKQKHAEAMYNLGMCFVNGEGVERNKETGLGFIRQAAKLGSKAAKQYRA